MIGTDFDILPTKIDWDDEDVIQRVKQYVDDRLDEAADFDDCFKRSNLIDLQNYASRVPLDWGFSFKLTDPITQNAVNMAMETTMGSTFAKERFFDLRGTSGQDEVQLEIKREHMLAAARHARWKMKYYNWGQDAALWGNGTMATFACPFWSKAAAQARAVQPDAFGYGVKTDRGSRLGYSQPQPQPIWPEYVNISRWDVYPYPRPGFSDVQDMPFFGFDLFLPLEQVKRMANRPWAMWKNTEKLKGTWGIDRNDRTVSASDLSYATIWDRLGWMGYKMVSDSEQTSGVIKTCRVRFFYEAPPGERGCRAYAIRCEDQLLACRGNDYDHAMKPVDCLKWIPFLATDCWQCWGVPSLIRPYSDRLQITIGQEYELRQKILFPTRLKRPGGDPSLLGKLLTAMAGDVIEANPEDVGLLDQPEPRSGLFDNKEDIRMGVATATRQTDINAGQAPTAGEASKTFRGLQYLGNAGSQAAVMRVLFFEEGGVVPNLEKLASILEQTLPLEGQDISLTDTNDVLAGANMKGHLLRVTPEAVEGTYEFYPVGASKALDGTAEAEALVTYLDKCAQMPEVRDHIDWQEAAKEVYELIRKRAPSRIWLSDQAYQEKMEKTPRPLPKEMLPKFGDVAKNDPGAAAQVLQRAGLEPSQPSFTNREAEAGKTQREVIKIAAAHHGKRQPRLLPVRQAQGEPKREPVVAGT
jgi:hypothetical protein